MDECLLDSLQPVMPYWIRTNFLSLCVCVSIYIHTIAQPVPFSPKGTENPFKDKGEPTHPHSLLDNSHFPHHLPDHSGDPNRATERKTHTDFLQNSCWHSEAASTFFSGYSPRGNMASGIHPNNASSHIKGSPHAQRKLLEPLLEPFLERSQSQPSRRKEKSSQVTA